MAYAQDFRSWTRALDHAEEFSRENPGTDVSIVQTPDLNPALSNIACKPKYWVQAPARPAGPGERLMAVLRDGDARASL